MLAFLVATALAALAGTALLIGMVVRSDTYLGVLGLISLCVAGITGAAYGVLHSAA